MYPCSQSQMDMLSRASWQIIQQLLKENHQHFMERDNRSVSWQPVCVFLCTQHTVKSKGSLGNMVHIPKKLVCFTRVTRSDEITNMLFI